MLMGHPWAVLVLLEHPWTMLVPPACPWATSVLLGCPWAVPVTLGCPRATLGGYPRAVGWVIAMTTGPITASWRRAVCCHGNQEHPGGLSPGFQLGQQCGFACCFEGNPSFPALLQKL